MAPELIQGRQYDSSADIWSFGITALELTHGRPPRSREPPQKVLLKTVQNEPPTLDREGGVFKYSKAFKEIIDSCLTKDPSKRPTAEQLLQTAFFKGAKKKSLLVNTILKDLPPLSARQERRALSSILSYRSIDSWDFATTIVRKHIYEDLEGQFGVKGSREPSASSSVRSRGSAKVPSWSHDTEEEHIDPELVDSELLLTGSSDVGPTQETKAGFAEEGTPVVSESSSDDLATNSSPNTSADRQPIGLDIKPQLSHQHSSAERSSERDGYPSSAPSQSILEQSYSQSQLKRSSSSSHPVEEKKRSGQSRLWRKLTGKGGSKAADSELKGQKGRD